MHRDSQVFQHSLLDRSVWLKKTVSSHRPSDFSTSLIYVCGSAMLIDIAIHATFEESKQVNYCFSKESQMRVGRCPYYCRKDTEWDENHRYSLSVSNYFRLTLGGSRCFWSSIVPQQLSLPFPLHDFMLKDNFYSIQNFSKMRGGLGLRPAHHRVFVAIFFD